MINILSLRCSLVFAPYLSDTTAEYLARGAITSRVVRQGGIGLILRSDGDLVLRHEHRQASLGIEDARHYAATIRMRMEFYDVLRLQDEVVLASVADELLLSHPQSQMWLTHEAVGALSRAFDWESSAAQDETVAGVPEWLKVSTGGVRLLLSDQRTARSVLLGRDHHVELERRFASSSQSGQTSAGHPPPTILLKTLTIHLQSAFKLASTLTDFVDHGRVVAFEDITPFYSLKASPCTEGIELRDSDNRIALTRRESGKWVTLLREELRRLNAHQFERGGIRTVFVDSEDGFWVLQWGDEILVPRDSQFLIESRSEDLCHAGALVYKSIGEFVVILNPGNGACVALSDSDSKFWMNRNPQQ